MGVPKNLQHRDIPKRYEERLDNKCVFGNHHLNPYHKRHQIPLKYCTLLPMQQCYNQNIHQFFKERTTVKPTVCN